MLHGLVARRTQAQRLWGCFTLAAGMLGASGDAAACGATPVEIEVLLPAAGASNVPRNAVLITSTNLTAARMLLREADGEANAAADAGPAPDGGGAPATLRLDIQCDEAPDGGALCLGRPRELLKA